MRRAATLFVPFRFVHRIELPEHHAGTRISSARLASILIVLIVSGGLAACSLHRAAAQETPQLALQFLEPASSVSRFAVQIDPGENTYTSELPVSILVPEGVDSVRVQLVTEQPDDEDRIFVDLGVENAIAAGVIPIEIASQVDQTSLNATLVATASSHPEIAPAILPMTLNLSSESNEPDWTKVVVEPAPVNMVATNPWPTFIRSDWARFLTYAAGVLLIFTGYWWPRLGFDTTLIGAKSWKSWFVIPIVIGAVLIAASVFAEEPGAHSDVRLLGVEQVQLNGLIKPYSPYTLLSASNGNTATVSLDSTGNSGGGGTQSADARVELISASGVGSFEGSLPLAPGTKDSAAIQIKATVRDLWVWPLLAVVVGVFIGWLLNTAYDTERSKKLILKTLRDIESDFERASSEVRKNPPSVFDELFEPPADCEAFAGYAFAERIDSIESSLASANTKVKLDKAAASAVDLRVMVANWPQLCRQGHDVAQITEELEEQIRRLYPDQNLETAQPLLVRSHALLTLQDVPPAFRREQDTHNCDWRWSITSADDVDARLLAMRETEQLLVQIQRVFLIHNFAKQVFDRTTSPENDPDVAMLSNILIVDNEKSFDAFQEAVSENLRAILIANQSTVTIADVFRSVLSDSKSKFSKSPSPFVVSGNWFERILSGRPHRVTAQELTAQLRTADYLVSGAVILLGAVVLLLSKYPDDFLGTLPQYLGLITAAATSTTIINQLVLPWSRPYSLPGPTKSEAKSKDDR